MKSLITCILSSIFLVTLSCSGKNTAATESVTVETNNAESYANTAEIDTKMVYDKVPENDFSVVITGDTVYFNVLKDKKSVSLVYWGRTNFDNHVIEIPSYITHQGTDYKVVEIGDEAMGVSFYGEYELERVWGTDANKVERIILPPTVKRIGDAAFTARFNNTDCVVELTDNVEYIGNCAVECLSIRDKDNAIVLPANIRCVEYLLDAEDYDIDDESFDGIYSRLYIPEHLEYIGGLDSFGRNQPLFRKVEVHPRNKHFKAINGALYSYALDSIQWSTIHEDLYIPKRLRVDKNTIDFLNDGWYTHSQMPLLKTIVVENGNKHCVAIDNVLYDKKAKCMILAGGGEENKVHVPAWCNSVYTIDGYGFTMPKTYIFALST